MVPEMLRMGFVRVKSVSGIYALLCIHGSVQRIAGLINLRCQMVASKSGYVRPIMRFVVMLQLVETN